MDKGSLLDQLIVTGTSSLGCLHENNRQKIIIENNINRFRVFMPNLKLKTNNSNIKQGIKKLL
jgi:hypothetical protein